MMEGYIKSIKFDRLTDRELERLADCTVSRLYANTFLEDSIYDRHMGVCDRGKLCETCSCDWESCAGGFGVINLPLPYYFDNVRVILKALNEICKKCFLVNCVCSEKKPYKFTIKKGKDKKSCEYEFHEKRQYNLEEIYDILKYSKSASSLMNYKLLVTPIYTRPYLTKNGQYLHNDISTIYNSIIKELNKQHDVNRRELFDKIEMLLTQKKSKLLPNSSKIPQSLQEKIQGKEGLINSNINGKRVDHSARANITGYPDGTMGVVGIPINMARKMTILENLCRILDTVDINDWVAKNKPLRVKKKNGKVFRFTAKTTSKIISSLDVSDYIERPLKDGDIILFNRQPSLRPESIIAKRVKIIDSQSCNTFRLTLPCTSPLNADFDGDECNVHVLQDLRAMVECYELMNPSEQIISSQKGTPLFVPVQDALIGSYLITDEYVVTRDELYDILFLLNKTYSFLLKKIEVWNRVNRDQIGAVYPGKFVFSLLFNEHFYYQLNDEFVIENGIILSGSSALSKRIFASGCKSILHKYYFSIGKWDTCSLIDEVQTLTNYFLVRRGFTIGLSDCTVRQSSYKNDPTVDVNTVLGRIEVQLGQPGFLNRRENNLYKVIQSGAKGSMTNIVQISQLVGQQSIDGTKVKSEMISKRTLVYSKPFSEQNYEESGFVKSSFYDGLKKSSNVFHAKAGRRGVADSVTKVSESGYTSKKICKFTENQVVEYDLSVRNNETKRIVQFLFGSDGMNPQGLPAEDGKKVYLTSEDCILLNLHKLNCFEDAVSVFSFCLNKIFIGLRKNNCVIDVLIKKILIQGITLLEKFSYTLECTSLDENELVTTLHYLLFKRLFQPGTAIGAICGMNFGEITSQLLLKSFHHAGIKNKDISGGIKRLNQLLNRTSSPLESDIICVARVKDEAYSILKTARKITDEILSKKILLVLMENRCHQLIANIKSLSFHSFVKESLFKKCECKSKDCTLFFQICNRKSDKFSIFYSLDVLKLDDSFLTLDIIKDILSDKVDFCITSEENSIRIETNLKDDGDIWSVIRKLSEINRQILNTKLGGFVKEFDIEYDETIEDFEIIFQGVKLSKITEISFVDTETIYSTDPFENTSIFGIEAGRYSLFNEISKVLSFDGADIDYRYLDLICDAMTCDGKIVSIVNSPGIITNALFEKEIKKLTTLSINKSTDYCQSVEACVFLGKLCRIGTGFVDILPKCS